MAITLKRQLTPEEKDIILQRHGRVCFATGHAIPNEESIHFDHIMAFALGGRSEIENIAPMCEYHNKAKGMLPLEDFRVSLQLQEFFRTGDRLTLKHLLQFLKTQSQIPSFGAHCAITQNDGVLKLESAHGNFTYDLIQCPTTGWKYFYATLPVELIDSDDDEDRQFGLQPRFLIFDKVFELFRHFQNHPVLQPSLGRIASGKIVLFDGQHKAAALLWAGRRKFECKIYIDPDLRVLNQTNISAHDKFAQTRFYASVMVFKLGGQFKKDFDDYKNREDQEIKSEAGFLAYLERVQDPTMTRGERNKRFRSFLFNAILEDSDNRMAKLVSTGNRGSNERPLTVDMVSKSFFANFLNDEPVTDNLASIAYKRDHEINNNVRLMNLFFDLSLCNWNPTAAANDQTRIRLERIYGSKSVLAWSEIFKDAVCAKLDITDSDDRIRPFYRELSESEWEKIKTMTSRLLTWTLWSSPPNSEIDSQLSTNKTTLKAWFREKGLTSGYLMGATE